MNGILVQHPNGPPENPCGAPRYAAADGTFQLGSDVDCLAVGVNCTILRWLLTRPAGSASAIVQSPTVPTRASLVPPPDMPGRYTVSVQAFSGPLGQLLQGTSTFTFVDFSGCPFDAAAVDNVLMTLADAQFASLNLINLTGTTHPTELGIAAIATIQARRPSCSIQVTP